MSAGGSATQRVRALAWRSSAARRMAQAWRIGRHLRDGPAVGWDDPNASYPILLDYPVRPRSRYGHGRAPHRELRDLLAAGSARYAQLLGDLAAWAGELRGIPRRAAPGGRDPAWSNGFFEGLDAVALSCLVAGLRPATYVEVGSGWSTRFVRRQIERHGLDTRIVSVDPRPRVDVDAISDELLRRGLEAAAAEVVGRLRAGDMLFIDGSHRSFMNSDVTVFFLDVLPRLAPGVLVQIHDIFLPDDYPSEWGPRHYSEQYLLAAWLLGGSRRIEVLLPAWFVAHDPGCRAALLALWRAAGLQGVAPIGGSFWLRTVG